MQVGITARENISAKGHTHFWFMNPHIHQFYVATDSCRILASSYIDKKGSSIEPAWASTGRDDGTK